MRTSYAYGRSILPRIWDSLLYHDDIYDAFSFVFNTFGLTDHHADLSLVLSHPYLYLTILISLTTPWISLVSCDENSTSASKTMSLAAYAQKDLYSMQHKAKPRFGRADGIYARLRVAARTRM